MKEWPAMIETEEYKEYRIEINPVPEERQFDFGDFGWAFQVFKSNSLCFQVVIKSAGGRQTEANRAHVLKWGREKVHAMIDTEDFEKDACYCYWWANIPANPSPERVDCDGFLLEGK